MVSLMTLKSLLIRYVGWRPVTGTINGKIPLWERNHFLKKYSFQHQYFRHQEPFCKHFLWWIFVSIASVKPNSYREKSRIRLLHYLPIFKHAKLFSQWPVRTAKVHVYAGILCRRLDTFPAGFIFTICKKCMVLFASGSNVVCVNSVYGNHRDVSSYFYYQGTRSKNIR